MPAVIDASTPLRDEKEQKDALCSHVCTVRFILVSEKLSSRLVFVAHESSGGGGCFADPAT